MRFVSSTDKLATVDQARERMERWRAAGERVVFVSGAFDLLDVGALRALAEARAGAERLVVAVWDDAAARSVLGPGRPLLAAADRTMLVAALRAVDLALISNEPSDERLGTTPDTDPVARVRERLGKS